MEKRLLEMSQFGKVDLTEFKKLLLDKELVDVDVPDEHGMSPLMHCAYHGHLGACQELLARGADVNNNAQKDGYTALMFAAVAGKSEVVRFLLTAGANPNTVNNLGKTASNMAAFVGQHESCQIISNYFSLRELEPFTTPDKLSKKPRLSPSLLPPLHTLITTTHIHPVKVLLGLQEEPALLASCPEIQAVLKTLGLRLVNDQREGLTLKLHYLSYLLQLARDSGLDPVITRMLTFDESGKPVQMDLLLRQCLREFPYPHLALLKQMVSSLAKTAPGDPPTAYILFVSVILGDKGAVASSDACFTCGNPQQDLLKKCSRCKKVWYCSVPCQQLAWTKGNHKKLCKRWTTPTTTTAATSN